MPYAAPLKERAGFLVLSRQPVRLRDHEDERDLRRIPPALSVPPGHEGVFEARAIVFDGSDDYHDRINDPALDIDENCILVIRGSGVIGWPGSAEVVNMQPPDALLQRGITSLPTLGDGRQSGTSDSPSILNASPESAAGGGLAWLRTGDMIRIDLNAGTLRRARRRGRDRAAARPSRRRRFRRAIRRGKSYSARRRASSPRAACWNSRSSIAERQRRRPATITEPAARRRGTGSRSPVVEVDDRIVGPGIAHPRDRLAVAGDHDVVSVGHAHRRSGSCPPPRRTARTRLAVAPLSACSGLVKLTTIALPVRDGADRQRARPCRRRRIGKACGRRAPGDARPPACWRDGCPSGSPRSIALASAACGSRSTARRCSLISAAQPLSTGLRRRLAPAGKADDQEGQLADRGTACASSPSTRRGAGRSPAGRRRLRPGTRRRP